MCEETSESTITKLEKQLESELDSLLQISFADTVYNDAWKQSFEAIGKKIQQLPNEKHNVLTDL